jgi:hypothetical protein
MKKVRFLKNHQKDDAFGKRTKNQTDLYDGSISERVISHRRLRF